MAKTTVKKIDREVLFSHFTIENLNDNIFWIDNLGKIIRVNDATCKLTGYTRSELESMSVFDLNKTEIPQNWKQHWKDLKKNKMLTFESVHTDKNGRSYPVEITNNLIVFEKKEYSCSIVRDLTKKKKEGEVIRLITEGIAGTIGMDFFTTLTRYITTVLGVRYSLITACANDENTRVRTISYAESGVPLENVEYDLSGTPCEIVMSGKDYFCANELNKNFPKEKGIQSYIGVPIQSPTTGKILGHIAALDIVPMAKDKIHIQILKIFSSRAGAEMDRIEAQKKLEIANNELQHLLKNSDERYRDLFEEAPIAYVHEGLDSRFIRANRAALRILGLKPAEVSHTFGKSLVPDTPEAQQRVKLAFESLGRGTDTNGVVIELKRKDNGDPIWIQWWSNPDPSGSFTRTMFIDITNQVLMEQERIRLEAQNKYLQEEIKLNHNFDEIVSRSKNFKKILQKVEQVASTDATVLILGESGTGKELLCRAIHGISKRSNKALVKINCAALPANLIESELFGHERGAFTGATERKIGRFELADGGTIFLDELGELPLELQSKLLRVLQEGEFERLGNPRTMKVNVRVIAATNRNLLEEIEKNNFREDLYYRLNVFPIESLPLRDRKEDIPLLVNHFIKKYEGKIGRKITQVPKKIIDLLMTYDFPGNIRELENIIERALIISHGGTLELGDWFPKVKQGESVKPVGLNDVEKKHIYEVLKKTNWKVSGERGAAKILGLKPTTLEAKMKKLGIKRES